MSFRSVRPGRPLPGLVALLAIVIAGASLLAACGATRVDALTVNGLSVSAHDFQRDIDALSSSSKLKALDKTNAQQAAAQGAQRLFDSKGVATRALTTSWLNRLANQLVVDREFKKLHLTVTAADKSEGASQFAQLFASSNADGSTNNGKDIVAQFPKWFRDQETARESRLVAVARGLEKQHPVTLAQEQAFYKANVGNLCPSGVNVSHILVKTLAEAQAIETQLAQGAKFATLAKTKSIDTGSAPAGGSLGCLKAGQFVAEFQTAAENAKLGVPTAPVHSQFGYHVILTSKYVPPSFASVESQIKQQLTSQANVVGTFVTTTLKTAKVSVAPQFGRWDSSLHSVQAPKVPAVRNGRSTTSTSATPTS